MKIFLPSRWGWTTAAAVAVVVAVPVAAHSGQTAVPDPVGVRQGATTLIAAGDKATTVTLITGDRVVLGRTGAVSLQPGRGRKHVTFAVTRVRGQVRVVPSDAAALVRAGRVDSRLFDISALIAAGYDDRRKDLPLVVTYPRGTASTSARSRVVAGGGKVARDLGRVQALTVRADRSTRSTMWTSLTRVGAGGASMRPGVRGLWLDGRRRLNLDVSVPQIGAPTAWKAGFTGAGVTVAVLDSGIDATHPDLKGRVRAARNFTEEPAGDHVGHGTHVASTIAGSGAASQGRFTGVAPGAALLDGQVCDFGCTDSALLAGMQWAVEQGADIVNMSLGGTDTPGVDPVEEAVNDLSARTGTLFVASAGNDGAEESVGSPASADAALAVAAVTKSDEPAEFSNRGPRPEDDAVKPDIAAPGVDIVAARAADGVIGTPADVAGYTSLSGTSMAAPHVAGAAAILAQQHPDWPGERLKAALMNAAVSTPGGTVYGQGAGRVDVATAVAAHVTATPPSVSFGRPRWPHTDDEKISRPVTFRNDGTEPLTLNLTVQAVGPGGAAPPAGMFTLGTDAVTVPAGGTATATVTADTSVDAPNGRYTGVVQATGGNQRVRVPFAVHREVESYDVTLRHIGLDGKPTDLYETTLFTLDDDSVYLKPYSAGATVTVRVPRGNYGVHSTVTTEGTDRQETVLMAQPLLAVTEDTTVSLDARLTRTTKVTVPQPGAEQTFTDIAAHWRAHVEGGVTASMVSLDGTAEPRMGQIGPDRAVPRFQSSLSASFHRPNGDGPWLNSPYVYHVAWQWPRIMKTGFRHDVRTNELATIRGDYAQQGAGTLGAKWWDPVYPYDHPDNASVYLFELPWKRTDYVNIAPGVRWAANFAEFVKRPEGYSEVTDTVRQAPRRYAPQQTYAELWNRSVFGPSVAAPPTDVTWASRRGDQIRVEPQLFGDGAGRPGRSEVATPRITLHRGDDLVGETTADRTTFAVPAEDAVYRLTAVAEREAPATLSTRVEVAWTFRSKHVAGDQAQRLPLSTVRFSPPLDATNTAPKAKTVVVPVTVDRQPGPAPAAMGQMTVEVSYDDGATWTATPVQGAGDRRQVSVAHPDAAGFVSLRATATDSAGNAVTQTVLRAYRIG